MPRIDMSNWGEFKVIKDLNFSISHGTRIKKADRLPGDNLFITAGKENMGIVGTIGNDIPIWKNPITVDMFGNAFYHPYECCGDDNIYAFENNTLSNHIKQFIAAVINQKNNVSFSYQDQFRQGDAEALTIKLPKKVKTVIDLTTLNSVSVGGVLI